MRQVILAEQMIDVAIVAGDQIRQIDEQWIADGLARCPPPRCTTR
jgi:hypothetical protein